jgi:hypothetical protein
MITRLAEGRGVVGVDAAAVDMERITRRYDLRNWGLSNSSFPWKLEIENGVLPRP